ncbi:MAG: hypothetical protein FJ011_26970 [Chloroflexi bacterium]|nr:hypothetical protein [Chloroflexota bacterium]
MFTSSTWALRIFGISGILGAMCLICGDLLYNHVPGSSSSKATKMGNLPESRLHNAGTLGLVGCWFYTLAALHLYLAFQPAGPIFAFMLSIAFGAVMVGYGIGHTAYFSIATGAHVAVRFGSDADQGAKLGRAFFRRIVHMIYIPAAISSLMMFYGIVAERSFYPRWMIVFLPVIVYLLKSPVIRITTGRVRELLNDSYDNVALFIFFIISTLVLWNSVVF